VVASLTPKRWGKLGLGEIELQFHFQLGSTLPACLEPRLIASRIAEPVPVAPHTRILIALHASTPAGQWGSAELNPRYAL